MVILTVGATPDQGANQRVRGAGYPTARTMSPAGGAASAPEVVGGHERRARTQPS